MVFVLGYRLRMVFVLGYRPGIEPTSPALESGSLTIEVPGKHILNEAYYQIHLERLFSVTFPLKHM